MTATTHTAPATLLPAPRRCRDCGQPKRLSEMKAWGARYLDICHDCWRARHRSKIANEQGRPMGRPSKGTGKKRLPKQAPPVPAWAEAPHPSRTTEAPPPRTLDVPAAVTALLQEAAGAGMEEPGADAPADAPADRPAVTDAGEDALGASHMALAAAIRALAREEALLVATEVATEWCSTMVPRLVRAAVAELTQGIARHLLRDLVDGVVQATTEHAQKEARA